VRARLASLDIARGVAIIAMIAYHLFWDLGNFGYIDPALPYSPQVKFLGHLIAISFLLIVGVSLVLAQDKGQGAFWRRIALIAGAAALVSLGTYLMFPEAFVFFGILHCIAAASVLALPLLNLPWFASLLAAALSIFAPLLLLNAIFDAPFLTWIGLSTSNPPTNDYRPLLPWAGYVFLGVAAAQLWRARALAPLCADWRNPPFAFLGRHSLAIYLIHQPILFGLFQGVASIGAFRTPMDDEVFLGQCEASCVEKLDAAYCHAQCLCIADGMRNVTLGELVDSEERVRRIQELAQICAERVETKPREQRQ